MNWDQLRKDIDDHIGGMQGLQVASGALWDHSTQCYCLFGLLSTVTGGPDPRVAIDTGPVYDYLDKRYGDQTNRSTVGYGHADDLIRTLGKRVALGVSVADAADVARVFLNIYVPPQERSDRTPAAEIPALSQDDLTVYPECPKPFGQRSEFCICAGLSEASRLNPGIHHDEGCIMWQLPDYGVFGPDE